MNKTYGKLRTEIMAKCPEDFSDELKSFIDNIEKQINHIRDDMEITSIGMLAKIEDAYDKLCDMADNLY